MAGIVDPSEPLGPFACAALKGKAEDLELLIHTGGGMDCGMAAFTAIKYSIFGSNLATYEYLVPRLPPQWVHKVDQMGRGPFHIALEWCGYHVGEIVGSLIDAGADVHLIDLNGDAPRDVARICDARVVYDGLSPGNVRKYFGALKSRGFDVELDQKTTCGGLHKIIQVIKIESFSPAGLRPSFEELLPPLEDRPLEYAISYTLLCRPRWLCFEN